MDLSLFFTVQACVYGTSWTVVKPLNIEMVNEIFGFAAEAA